MLAGAGRTEAPSNPSCPARGVAPGGRTRRRGGTRCAAPTTRSARRMRASRTKADSCETDTPTARPAPAPEPHPPHLPAPHPAPGRPRPVRTPAGPAAGLPGGVRGRVHHLHRGHRQSVAAAARGNVTPRTRHHGDVSSGDTGKRPQDPTKTSGEGKRWSTARQARSPGGRLHAGGCGREPPHPPVGHTVGVA